MSIAENKDAFVDPAAVAIGLSQMFTVTAGTGDPAYVVLTVLDRDEYAANATGATGTLSGNGNILGLGDLGGDGRGAGIVFTYQASTGEYYNSTYGYLNQLTYNSSASLNDVTNLSLFGTNSLNLASADATNAISIMEDDPSGYLGSVTVVTQPGATGTVPAQATPNSIAAAADSFVGQAWNTDGCWTLASTIAADAGTSLPLQSTLIGIPGAPNGEWIVAFDGPAGQTGDWQSMVKTGDIVVIGTLDDGGHITTCVSGSGATAMLVDNITYVNASGQIQNPANDGSADDVVVEAPHPASQEWDGVEASSVVIYELDTPAVACTVATDSLATGVSQALGPLFTATDPASRAITEWQVYDTAATDALVVNGAADGAHSAASALTVSSLNSVALLAGPVATTDTLEVRAFNGGYWGDWQSLAVGVGEPGPEAPVLNTQTPNQTWTAGEPVSLALSANTFTDPQGEALTYSATQFNGQPLPSWLSFNPATETFSGTPPATVQNLNIQLTATDSNGLSSSENFAATIDTAPLTEGPPNITVTDPTPIQNWADGEAVALVLPANTFTDALGLNMTFAAYEVSGPNVTSWLHYNAATDELYGTVPATQNGTIGIAVIATDALNASAMDLFSVTFPGGSSRFHPGSAVQTAASTVTPATMSESLVLQS